MERECGQEQAPTIGSKLTDTARRKGWPLFSPTSCQQVKELKLQQGDADWPSERPERYLQQTFGNPTLKHRFHPYEYSPWSRASCLEARAGLCQAWESQISDCHQEMG